MNEIGPPRTQLSRAAPVLAIGLALVLAGGFAVGIFVGRKPVPPVSPGAESLPPQPAAEPILPDLALRPHESPPPAAPAPAAPPASSPPVVPPVVREPVVAARPAAPQVRPEPVAEPVPVPARKPTPPPTAEAAPKRRIESRVATALKPAARHAEIAEPPRVETRRHRTAPPGPLPQPASDGRWVVQLGAFQSDDHAKLLVDTLAFHGHAARIAGRHDRHGRDWYFVQTPGYATRGDAEAVASQLAKREHVPTFVFKTTD